MSPSHPTTKKLLTQGRNGSSSKAKAAKTVESTPTSLRQMSIRLSKSRERLQVSENESQEEKEGRTKKAMKTQKDQGQMVHQPLVPITVEEYMLEEWFKMVEKDEEEEVL